MLKVALIFSSGSRINPWRINPSAWTESSLSPEGFKKKSYYIVFLLKSVKKFLSRSFSPEGMIRYSEQIFNPLLWVKILFLTLWKQGYIQVHTQKHLGETQDFRVTNDQGYDFKCVKINENSYLIDPTVGFKVIPL